MNCGIGKYSGKKNADKAKKNHMYVKRSNDYCPFQTNSENILEEALYVYDYIHEILGIKEENIIVLGRSIGSGPAIHVASKRSTGALILISPFKSIRNIA